MFVLMFVSAMGYRCLSISWSLLWVMHLYNFDQFYGVFMFILMFISTMGYMCVSPFWSLPWVIHFYNFDHCYEVYVFVNVGQCYGV